MNNIRELVSIVVCTYNGQDYLASQLDSLLAQTYSNLEILIVDDHSTDRTVEIAESYVSKDTRVKLFVNKSNLGYNRNFEQGFHFARGNFIAVCDQDDIWKDEKIEKMVLLFDDRKEVLLVHCQSVRFMDQLPNISTYTLRNFFEGTDARKLMYFNTIAGHNMIFRKQLLGLSSPFPQGVFYDWWLSVCAAVNGEIRGTNEVLTWHRYHASNVTLGKKDEKKQTRKKAEERIHTLKHILKLDELSIEERNFGKELFRALSTLEHRDFSFRLFSFLLQHAHLVFFFKKKGWFSRLKIAYRLSFAKS